MTDLTADNTEYIVRDYEERRADIVYTATINGQEVIFYILLELQSTVDYSMPIRLLMYTTEIWRKYLKQHSKEEVKQKDFKLPAVVPIVLYNGKEKWHVDKSFKEKIQSNEKFSNHIIDFEYILVSVNDYQEEDLLKISNVVSSIFLLDQKINEEEFLQRALAVAEAFEHIKDNHQLQVKDWLAHILKNPLRDSVLQVLDAPNKEEAMKMVANITKTLEESRRRAEEKGDRNAKLEIVKNAKKMGLSTQQIEELTGLSEEEIEKMK